MTYTLTASPDIVIRDADGAYIPFDPGNADYQGYVVWVSEGNTPSPYVPPLPPIPQVVPLWAVRTVLHNHELLDQTNTIITTSDNIALKNLWEYGNDVSRTSATLDALASELGLTSEQVDQMFIEANSLTV